MVRLSIRAEVTLYNEVSCTEIIFNDCFYTSIALFIGRFCVKLFMTFQTRFSGTSRYEYTHQILKEDLSKFMDTIVPRDRRISIICRNEPRSEDL